MLLTNSHLEANFIRTNTIYWMGRNVKTNLYTPAGRSNMSAIIVGCWTHRKMQRKSNKEYGTCFSFVYYTSIILRHVLAEQKGAIDQHFFLLKSPQICLGEADSLLRRQYLITYRQNIFLRVYLLQCGPGSVVGIMTVYGLDGPGIESRWGEIFRTSPDRPWGPPNPLYNWYRVFPGGKVLQGRDADPSPPSSAGV